MKTGLAMLMMALTGVFFLSGQMPGASVQAASAKTMQRAYKKYLKNNVSEKKRFAIADIGEKGKPALLIGTVKAPDVKNFYNGCDVYYYKNGKVKKVDTLLEGRFLSYSKKKGQKFLTNGGSDYCIHLCVKKGKVYRYEYYNNHNWKKVPGDKWKQSVVKAGGSIVRNYGYLDAGAYEAWRDSFTIKKAVKFVKNTKANRKKIVKGQ